MYLDLTYSISYLGNLIKSISYPNFCKRVNGSGSTYRVFLIPPWGTHYPPQHIGAKQPEYSTIMEHMYVSVCTYIL